MPQKGRKNTLGKIAIFYHQALGACEYTAESSFYEAHSSAPDLQKNIEGISGQFNDKISANDINAADTTSDKFASSVQNLSHPVPMVPSAAVTPRISLAHMPQYTQYPHPPLYSIEAAILSR